MSEQAPSPAETYDDEQQGIAVPVAGFFSGVLLAISAPFLRDFVGGLIPGDLLPEMVERIAIVALVVIPVTFLTWPRTRRFATYMLVGFVAMLVIVGVVLGIAAVLILSG